MSQRLAALRAERRHVLGKLMPAAAADPIATGGLRVPAPVACRARRPVRPTGGIVATPPRVGRRQRSRPLPQVQDPKQDHDQPDTEPPDQRRKPSDLNPTSLQPPRVRVRPISEPDGDQGPKKLAQHAVVRPDACTKFPLPSSGVTIRDRVLGAFTGRSVSIRRLDRRVDDPPCPSRRS